MLLEEQSDAHNLEGRSIDKDRLRERGGKKQQQLPQT